mgnify:CR=1 FL=1
MTIKKDLEELKKYCIAYVDKTYGVNNNYIRKMKATKNGLFIYGHKVYAPGYSLIYTIQTYISWYENGNYNYINDLLDNFVLDCKRLNEC